MAPVRSAAAPAPFRRCRLEVEAASRGELVEVLTDLGVRIAEYAGLSAEEAYFLGVALREAVVNAIRHGNREDASRRVNLRFRIKEHHLRVRVQDQGPGFDPLRLPDPLSSENMAKGGGRGIFYMRNCVDRVSFRFPRTGGTVVFLEKRLGS